MCMGGRGKSFIKNNVPKVVKMPSAKIAKPVVKKTTEVKENIVKATPVAKITKTSKARSGLRIPTSNLTYG